MTSTTMMRLSNAVSLCDSRDQRLLLPHLRSPLPSGYGCSLSPREPAAASTRDPALRPVDVLVRNGAGRFGVGELLSDAFPSPVLSAGADYDSDTTASSEPAAGREQSAAKREQTTAAEERPFATGTAGALSDYALGIGGGGEDLDASRCLDDELLDLPQLFPNTLTDSKRHDSPLEGSSFPSWPKDSVMGDVGVVSPTHPTHTLWDSGKENDPATVGKDFGSPPLTVGSKLVGPDGPATPPSGLGGGSLDALLAPQKLRRYVSVPKIHLNFSDPLDVHADKELRAPEGLGSPLVDFVPRDTVQAGFDLVGPPPTLHFDSDTSGNDLMDDSLETFSAASLPQVTPKSRSRGEKRPASEHKVGGFACTSCRTSKTKCEGGLPCRRCLRLGRECRREERPVKRSKAAARRELETLLRNAGGSGASDALARSIVLGGGFDMKDCLSMGRGGGEQRAKTQCYRNEWCVRHYRHPGHCKPPGHTRRRSRKKRRQEKEAAARFAGA